MLAFYEVQIGDSTVTKKPGYSATFVPRSESMYCDSGSIPGRADRHWRCLRIIHSLCLPGSQIYRDSRTVLTLRQSLFVELLPSRLHLIKLRQERNSLLERTGCLKLAGDKGLRNCDLFSVIHIFTSPSVLNIGFYDKQYYISEGKK